MIDILIKVAKVAGSILIAMFIAFILYCAFVLMPVQMYTEAECLRQGYPEHRVTIGLGRYCMTIDGAVTVQVDKQ